MTSIYIQETVILMKQSSPNNRSDCHKYNLRSGTNQNFHTDYKKQLTPIWCEDFLLICFLHWRARAYKTTKNSEGGWICNEQGIHNLEELYEGWCQTKRWPKKENQLAIPSSLVLMTAAPVAKNMRWKGKTQINSKCQLCFITNPRIVLNYINNFKRCCTVYFSNCCV